MLCTRKLIIHGAKEGSFYFQVGGWVSDAIGMPSGGLGHGASTDLVFAGSAVEAKTRSGTHDTLTERKARVAKALSVSAKVNIKIGITTGAHLDAAHRLAAAKARAFTVDRIGAMVLVPGVCCDVASVGPCASCDAPCACLTLG